MAAIGILGRKALAFAYGVLAVGVLITVQAQEVPKTAAQAGDKSENSAHRAANAPQDFVVCTGWHALCSASPDCRIAGGHADCDCLRVNENHIVATSEIQDTAVKRRTLARCTKGKPCEVDEAPVCKAIQSGQYEVDNIRYQWVSTYSYRGWCDILKNGLKACDQRVAGYVGDHYWAICDAAPCVENPYPASPDKPLKCQCRLDSAPFVGMGSCTAVNGGAMSSFPLWAWDFEKNTYPFAMPGYEYVQGACAPLQSDSLPDERRGGVAR